MMDIIPGGKFEEKVILDGGRFIDLVNDLGQGQFLRQERQ
jgi:hypothetical protein